MDTNSRTHDNGGKLPVLLRLTPPSLEDTGAFRFEKNDNGIEKAFIGLPFKETAREIDLPLRNTATLEVDRFRTGEYFVYAIGLVEKDPLTLMRKHFSEVSRFIGVADRLPVHDTYKTGLFNTEKAEQILRLANMMALFNALGRDRDDMLFVPTPEQSMFHMNYADELQSARDALMRDLPLCPVRDKKSAAARIRQFGVIEGGKPQP